MKSLILIILLTITACNKPDTIKYRHSITCKISSEYNSFSFTHFKSNGPVMYGSSRWSFKDELSGKFIHVKADCIDYIDENIGIKK